VSVNDLVLVQGMADTKRALARWNRAPRAVLRPWFALSAAIALALLLSVYLIAEAAPEDTTRFLIPGYNAEVTYADYAHVLFRNSLVLALHALACVAGFIAGSAMPLSASHRTGFSRWIHEKAGPLAIAFVVGATLFSLGTQAFVLGLEAASMAGQIGTNPAALLATRLPHAIPELIALFLPLAAWMIASRKQAWDELLAATFVTVSIAVPILLGAAAVEVWVAPKLLLGLGH
jgi:hypothetical protein